MDGLRTFNPLVACWVTVHRSGCGGGFVTAPQPTPVIAEHDVTVLLGDVREALATLPDGSVQCIVTSPPYYGLRDYGVDGQIGLEPSPVEYVETMRGVFSDAWRVGRKSIGIELNPAYVEIIRDRIGPATLDFSAPGEAS